MNRCLQTISVTRALALGAFHSSRCNNGFSHFVPAKHAAATHARSSARTRFRVVTSPMPGCVFNNTAFNRWAPKQKPAASQNEFSSGRAPPKCRPVLAQYRPHFVLAKIRLISDSSTIDHCECVVDAHCSFLTCKVNRC